MDNVSRTALVRELMAQHESYKRSVQRSEWLHRQTEENDHERSLCYETVVALIRDLDQHCPGWATSLEPKFAELADVHFELSEDMTAPG